MPHQENADANNQKKLLNTIYSIQWKLTETQNRHRKLITHVTSLNKIMNEVTSDVNKTANHLYQQINLITNDNGLKFLLNSGMMKVHQNMGEIIKIYKTIETNLIITLDDERKEKNGIEVSQHDYIARLLITHQERRE